jgi:hypothetical protein
LGSWPRTLLTEMVCAHGGMRAFTRDELRRILGDQQTGPLGFWMIAEMLRVGGDNRGAQLFATKGSNLCNPRGFGLELDLLTRWNPELLVELSRALSTIEREELPALAAEDISIYELFDESKMAEDRVSRARSGRRVAEFLWASLIEELLRKRLEFLLRSL